MNALLEKLIAYINTKETISCRICHEKEIDENGNHSIRKCYEYLEGIDYINSEKIYYMEKRVSRAEYCFEWILGGIAESKLPYEHPYAFNCKFNPLFGLNAGGSPLLEPVIVKGQFKGFKMDLNPGRSISNISWEDLQELFAAFETNPKFANQVVVLNISNLQLRGKIIFPPSLTNLTSLIMCKMSAELKVSEKQSEDILGAVFMYSWDGIPNPVPNFSSLIHLRLLDLQQTRFYAWPDFPKTLEVLLLGANGIDWAPRLPKELHYLGQCIEDPLPDPSIASLPYLKQCLIYTKLDYCKYSDENRELIEMSCPKIPSIAILNCLSQMKEERYLLCVYRKEKFHINSLLNRHHFKSILSTTQSLTIKDNLDQHFNLSTLFAYSKPLQENTDIANFLRNNIEFRFAVRDYLLLVNSTVLNKDIALYVVISGFFINLVERAGTILKNLLLDNKNQQELQDLDVYLNKLPARFDDDVMLGLSNNLVKIINSAFVQSQVIRPKQLPTPKLLFSKLKIVDSKEKPIETRSRKLLLE